MTIRRIGVSTGGGDCPGLNAVIRAVVLKACAQGWEVLGIEDALAGLIDIHNKTPHGNRLLEPSTVDGILPTGGTILGTSNRCDPFAFVAEGQTEPRDLSQQVLANCKQLELDAIVMIGGDGSMRIAQRLAELGLNVVGVPKTIDQDIGATDYTFGFNTAVQTATEAVDRLQDTAESHDRIMIVEVMGRHAGWIALHTAIAGAAHTCLIPEIPFHVERVAAAAQARKDRGAPFSVVILAEGASPVGMEPSYRAAQEAGGMPRLAGAGNDLASALAPHVNLDVRVTTLGHIQRGGSPVHFDRVLGTRFGAAAVDLVAQGRFGELVVLRTPDISSVLIAEALAAPARIDPSCQLVQTARDVGIVFGD